MCLPALAVIFLSMYLTPLWSRYFLRVAQGAQVVWLYTIIPTPLMFFLVPVICSLQILVALVLALAFLLVMFGLVLLVFPLWLSFGVGLGRGLGLVGRLTA